MSTGHIVTVLGPVVTLGIADAHNHLYIGRVPGAPDDAPALTDSEGVARELIRFRAMGGGGIVDCQPGGCGRDGRVLRALSEQTGVAIVAATGFHRRRYYPPDAPLFALSAEAAASYFLGEIRGGLEETRGKDPSPQPSPGGRGSKTEPSPPGRGGENVYPGVIKMAAEATLAESPAALFAAAAAVAAETGYAIEVHTERGAAVEALLAYFVDRGVAPERLVFCHVDKRPDVGLHRELAAAGVLLEYDTFYRPQYDPERGVWPLLAQMLAAGWGQRIALATDMADPALWAELGGGPGLPGIFTVIKPRLEQMGADAATVAGLLGGNICARLRLEDNDE
ncbi:MAG TPA: hypothetical protein PK829_07555 [Promineifilum sp.]|nr:hypothetical protein [Promineifilum sp.]